MSETAGLSPVTFFTLASADPLRIAAILLTTGWYLWAVRRLRSRGRQWPWQRTASFLLGELVLAASLLSGIATLAQVSFFDHIIGHIGLAMLAPFFLVMSAPVTLLLQSGSQRVQSAGLKVIHGPVGKVAASPLVTWPLYGGSLFVLYFTGLYAHSLTDTTVQQLVHLELVLTGCLFFWPVIAVDPVPRRLNYGIKILYLMLALPVYTVLGMALESQTTPIAPGISLADLHAGAALLWVSGEAVGLIGAIVVFIMWLRADERQARRNDGMNEEAAARQLALWRATRDAAARAASAP